MARAFSLLAAAAAAMGEYERLGEEKCRVYASTMSPAGPNAAVIQACPLHPTRRWRDDARCGPRYGYTYCNVDHGNAWICCSSAGWCGRSNAHCEHNNNTIYSSCDSTASPTVAPYHPGSPFGNLAVCRIAPGDTVTSCTGDGSTVRCGGWIGESCNYLEYLLNGDWWRVYSGDDDTSDVDEEYNEGLNIVS
eukprot:gene47194-biopygen109277